MRTTHTGYAIVVRFEDGWSVSVDATTNTPRIYTAVMGGKEAAMLDAKGFNQRLPEPFYFVAPVVITVELTGEAAAP